MPTNRFNSSPGSTPEPARAVDAINAYVIGQDGNRPHAISRAFTEDAELTIQGDAARIGLPLRVTGRSSIAKVLVTGFHNAWENVYTLCIGTQPPDNATAFSCDWMMAMSAKRDGTPMIGCGRYDWRFEPESHRARSLAIRIDALEAPRCDADVVTDWVAALPYPWCARAKIIAAPPSVPGLLVIVERLKTSS